MERRERITTSQGLGIRTPERGLGPLFSLVVVLLLCDNFLIGWVLSFPTTWPVSSCKIPIVNSSTSSPSPLLSHRSVVAVLVWYFHGLGALMNLFHLWSNLYFEMLYASLVSWFETYSVTLAHLILPIHLKSWIILMYRDINLRKSFMVKNMRCCRKDNLLPENFTRDGPNNAGFCKT